VANKELDFASHTAPACCNEVAIIARIGFLVTRFKSVYSSCSSTAVDSNEKLRGDGDSVVPRTSVAFTDQEIVCQVCRPAESAFIGDLKLYSIGQAGFLNDYIFALALVVIFERSAGSQGAIADVKL
jgi:hypothetical protein